MRFLSRFKPPVLLLVTLSLVGLLASVLVGVSMLGVVPDAETETRQRRKELCESAAIGFSLMAQRADTRTMTKYLDGIASRGSDIVSMAVRKSDGSVVVSTGDHLVHWDPAGHDDTQVEVNLYGEGEIWGHFEAKFQQAGAGNLLTPYASIDQLLIVCSFCLFAFYFYLRIVLRQLDPSGVIPHRVRDALDTLAEGLLVLDAQERIVLANRSFEKSTNTERDRLLGKPISRLPLIDRNETPDEMTPWRRAIHHGVSLQGRLFGVSTEDALDRTFSVSVSPILDEAGKTRGALASFEDVTRLEEKKRELADAVTSLQQSSDEIRRQNHELSRLATSDPLTNCMNRRAFFDVFDSQWASATRYRHPLAAMMVDIDYFKSINDDHGHSSGDEVLRRVGALLNDLARETDTVCRYGGEEFVILLTHTSETDAAILAERIRCAMADLEFGKFTITASLGVAEISETTADPQDLLDQADKCLYVAKRNGRNQVVCWSDVPEDLVVDESKISRVKDDDISVAVPYHAVTALISALAYRDESTAAHCRRVADICVAVGDGLLSLKQCYTLEVAALLHDIGKVGVPDNILLKPNQLDDEEWAVMRRHDQIGKEIIRASFASPQLTDIVESYQRRFEHDGNLRDTPLAARILAVADAYDSMTANCVYRTPKTRDEAFAELRRCAGTQFDPEIVERLITTISRNNTLNRTDIEAVPKETALAIGLQIERMAEALDAQDFEALGAVSKRLEMTAQKYNAEAIATQASKMSAVLEHEDDLFSILETANELLTTCRQSQRAFVSPQLAMTAD